MDIIELLPLFEDNPFDLLPLFEENNPEIAIYDYVLNTKNRVYHYVDKEPGRFDLGQLGDSYCFTHFRFYKNDIRRLIPVLKIPEKIIFTNRVTVSGEEALCVLLRRLAYPNRFLNFLTHFQIRGLLHFIVLYS